jgi:glycosyltransferase involved in cell wall biosynthesis
MTLHNKGPYVEEAVRSVLASTLGDFELLVVDDASTDGGAVTVGRIADPRIKLISTGRNLGRPSAANLGLDHAKGEYVAILDADDVMAPDRLQKQAAYLDAHPAVGVVGSWLPAFGSDGRTFAMPESDPECKALALFGAPVSYGAAMFRNRIVQGHRLRCDTEWLTPGMDYLFVLQLGAHAAYANLSEPLTRYRVGEQNMRHGRDPWSDGVLLAAEVLKRMGLPHDPGSARTHAILSGLLPADARTADVRVLGAWMGVLRAWRARTGYCPAEAFDHELAKRADWLFQKLLQQRPWLGLAFLMQRELGTIRRAKQWASAMRRS